MNLNASYLASLPTEERNRILDSLTADEKLELLYLWEFWRRDNQKPPPGDWGTWLIQSGRGFGKTRTGAETVREAAETKPGIRIGLVGRTTADVRMTMVKGTAGILSVCPPWFYPTYEPSNRELIWPNGTIATTFSADEPDLLRGPELDLVWADEAAAWRYEETWDNINLCLRAGTDPRAIVTTTPKPTKVFKTILKESGTVVTRGTTYDNLDNLAAKYIRQIKEKYEGTRLGQQELHGILIDDNPNALFKRAIIDKYRVKVAPQLVRIIVAIDPNASEEKNLDDNDETGIIVAGVGANGHAYLIEDLSDFLLPDDWAEVSVEAFKRHRANMIVAEKNNGGAMITSVIRAKDRNVPVELVWASHGKERRAEPVSVFYERGLVHHVGTFAELEAQMCDFVPGLAKKQKSPDRMDAMVWALTKLLVSTTGSGEVYADY